MAMFSMHEEHRAVQQSTRDFVQRYLAADVVKRDKEARLPNTLIRQAGKAGFMAMQVAPRYGGSGLDSVSYVLAIEEIAKVDASIALCLSVNNSLVCWLVETYGSDEQRQQYLPLLATGEWVGAFCLSEPEAGSDAIFQRTNALLSGDHYLLNGVKNWVTNGQRAKLYVVVAQSDPAKKSRGINMFLVERDMPGVSVAPTEDKMGLRASDTCSIMFQDVQLPLTARLGAKGQGFVYAMRALTNGRIGVAAQAVGIGQGALDCSLQYAQEREAFGKKIAYHQAIKFKLADMATQLEAARLLTLRAACLRDAGKDFTQASSVCKLYASEVCMRATTEAVQIHGGYGYVREYHVERMMRDAKVTQIYEGTSEIQRMLIARKILS